MKPSSYLIVLLTCVLIATTNSGVCLAQNRTIDSLNAALTAAKDDTIKIKILRDLNSEYWKHTQPDSALYSYRRALSIAEKLDDKYWYGIMLYEIASHYNQRGIYDSSFVYQNKALQIALQIKNNKILRGYYSNQMSLYIGLQDYRKAMKSVRETLYYAELEEDSTMIAWAYANIGGIFRYQKLYDSALIYTNKGFALRKKLGQRTTEGGFININSIGRSFQGIGETLVSQGRYEDARPYLDSAILFLRNSGLWQSLSRVYLLSSIVWKEIGNLDSSLFYVQKAINLAESYGGRPVLQESYWHLADIYAQTGKYEEAFEYQKRSIYLKDSLNLTTLRQSISVMEIAEQIALQEKAVEEERRVRNIWVIGFGGVFIVALWLGWLYRAKRRANDEISLQASEIQLKNTELHESLETLRRTQIQLAQAEKMASLGTLVAGVAHELNTPIGVAVTAASTLHGRTKAFAERYKEGGLKKSELEGYIETAEIGADLTLRNLERAANLIQSFKQVAVDQTSDQKRRFHLHQYVQGVITSLEPKWKTTNHRVEIECDETIELETYPGAIAQIITNLIDNSLLHGFQGYTESGVMRIVAEKEDDRITLTYSDNGRGIPPKVLPRIFDPFFTTKQANGGTGLGMHIVYNLVTQKLGGEIRCLSEPEKGGTFVIIIPRVLSEKS